jgi:polar amino acid transport system substrate-binding protein
MRARAAFVVALAMVVLAVACKGGNARGAPTTTTTTIPGVSTTTTATTTAPTADPGFRTRERGVLTVATDSMVAPYFVVANGQPVGGLEYDLANLIASRLRVAVHVVPVPLLALVTSYDCGCDLYLGQVPATEVLARSIDLSEPYLTADQAVVVRAGETLTTRAAAQQLRWGMQVTDGDAIAWVNRTVQPATPIQLAPDEPSLLATLHAGQVDAVMLDAPSALLAVAGDPTVVIAGRVPTSGAYAAVLPLGSPNTSALNDLIRDLRNRGTLALLARLFLGQEPETIPTLTLS